MMYSILNYYNVNIYFIFDHTYFTPTHIYLLNLPYLLPTHQETRKINDLDISQSYVFIIYKHYIII